MTTYCVYILSSLSRRLYIGITNNIQHRLWQHLTGDPTASAFARKYRINRLVHYEWFNDVTIAIAREKQLKRWNRAKKIWLIERQNPDWLDLAPSLGISVPLSER
jgi:putative endonuclease